MITDDKITKIFCDTDEFSKKFDEEIENMPLLTSDGKGTMGWCHGFKLHFGAGGNVRGYPPCSLTKYPSATEHEERQVANSMYLCSQSFNLGIE